MGDCGVCPNLPLLCHLTVSQRFLSLISKVELLIQFSTSNDKDNALLLLVRLNYLINWLCGRHIISSRISDDILFDQHLVSGLLQCQTSVSYAVPDAENHWGVYSPFPDTININPGWVPPRNAYLLLGQRVRRKPNSKLAVVCSAEPDTRANLITRD